MTTPEYDALGKQIRSSQMGSMEWEVSRNQFCNAIRPLITRLVKSRCRVWAQSLDRDALIDDSILRMLDCAVNWRDDIRSFESLAGTTVRHAVIDSIDAAFCLKRKVNISDGSIDPDTECNASTSTQSTSASFELESQETLAHWRNLLSNDELFSVLLMRLDGLSLDETAKLKNVSKSTIKRRWDRIVTVLVGDPRECVVRIDTMHDNPNSKPQQPTASQC